MSPVASIGTPGYIIFWLLFAVALGLFLQRAYILLRLLKLGKPENRFDQPVRRFFSMLVLFFTQASNLKSLTLRDPAALGHTVMLWGLMVFGLAYIIFIGFGGGFALFDKLSNTRFEITFFSVLDAVALVVILAMIWVVIKRYILVPERLKRKRDLAESVIQPLLIIVIAGLMVLHFGVEGFRYVAYGIPEPGPLLGAPLARALAATDISMDPAVAVYRGLWWLNYVILLVAVVYAPRSKHLHPLTSFANLYFKSLAPKGSLKPVDLKNKETYGASEIGDFSWKQLLDLYACTWCGRCHVACPAQASGKPLSPRELVLGMKEHLSKEGPALLKAGPAKPAAAVPQNGDAKEAPAAETTGTGKSIIGEVISEDAIWACTTCRACQEVCPVSIEHIDKIIDLRRHLQMVSTTETGRDTMKNLRVRGNPWRGTMYGRTDWAEGLDIKIVAEDSNIDVLFWVGCTGALEDRSLKITRAVAGLMKAAGVKFGILGEEEMCCGDPARRLGAEHLYQMLAANNIQLLQSYNVKKIVTACPHCFNTLKHEYPRSGGRFEVLHHSEFIGGLIREKKLKLRSSGQTSVTYQDPCYLGRYNDIYTAPREILKAIPGLTLKEMAANKKSAFCCGGGGGRLWLEEKIGQRISELRLDHAISARSGVVATACPYCLQMFEDAAKAREVEETLQVRDIAELVEASLETVPATPGAEKADSAQ